MGKSFGRYKVADGVDSEVFEAQMEKKLFPFLRALIREVKHLFPGFIVNLPVLSQTLAGLLFSF